MAKGLARLLALSLSAAVVVSGQAERSRKDIPTIAKAADGSIVSIVMSDDKAEPIAQGTGFVVTKDGLILTNYHVIAEGTSAVAKMPDGAIYVLEGAVAWDKTRDIALVKAIGKNFKTVSLGNSNHVEVGQEVVTIGNPLSLESTVSNGIVSGIRDEEELGGKFLQVTAPISPGSSGGPLFNMAGEVIGITTLYLKGGENLNFAIPINDATQMIANPCGQQDLPPIPPGYTLDCGKLHPVWPNEAALATAQNADSSSLTTKTVSTPELDTTIEFMDRMVEPEHREIVLGVMEGAVLHSKNGPAVTIISKQLTIMVFTDGVTQKNGYPEFLYTMVSDSDGEHEQKDYPRYTSFALGDIDPSSVEAKEGGYDLGALMKFWDEHPRCEADPQCAHEYLSFLHSAPKMISVEFHTTDLKPLIERGGCSVTSDCSLSKTTGSVAITFKSKDRAERFVTALVYAVNSAGGKPDFFPPTHFSKKD